MLPPMIDVNAYLIERFYAAFDARDGDAMAACYAPGAHFSDPVFPDLNGDEPGAMWRMLTSQARELRIELVEHEAEDDRGSGRWRAHYVFSQTGRPVVNDVRASFRFADGLIAEHTDDFSFYRWSRQALGAPGLLLGWTPLLRTAVRKKAAASLASFMQRDAHSSSA
jgi:ketosteroid isomerase-like protein